MNIHLSICPLMRGEGSFTEAPGASGGLAFRKARTKAYDHVINCHEARAIHISPSLPRSSPGAGNSVLTRVVVNNHRKSSSSRNITDTSLGEPHILIFSWCSEDRQSGRSPYHLQLERMRTFKLVVAVWFVLHLSETKVRVACKPAEGTYEGWIRARGFQKQLEDHPTSERDLQSLGTAQSAKLFQRKRLSGLERRTFSRLLTVAVQRRVWPSSSHWRAVSTGEETLAQR